MRTGDVENCRIVVAITIVVGRGDAFAAACVRKVGWKVKLVRFLRGCVRICGGRWMSVRRPREVKKVETVKGGILAAFN